MGRGDRGARRLGLPKYAKAFAARGKAAHALDYQYFEASDGEGRQAVIVPRAARRLPGGGTVCALTGGQIRAGASSADAARCSSPSGATITNWAATLDSPR